MKNIYCHILKNTYICELELRYGVMVALQILVLPVWVRVPIPQRKGRFSATFLR